MSVLFTYLLFIGAGIAVAAPTRCSRVNKLASGILLALAVLAAGSRRTASVTRKSDCVCDAKSDCV